MSVKLLTEHHLEFLSLKGGCTGSSVSALIKIPHCWKSHIVAQPRGRGFEPNLRLCVVSLSKNINPSLVLVQHRKTRPFITERLLMGHKESNQTKKNRGSILI